MIVFDTNPVNLFSPDGLRADVLRTLRKSGHHRIAVPWMVMEEMAAHKAAFYREKHQSVVTALGKLQEAVPWELQSSVEPPDLERLLDHWRAVYGEIFEVIETSGDVALRALAREALSLPPAKRVKEHSEGARDVAIWFSILEFLKANPDQHVYFVTNNSKDFGDGTLYPYPMNEDLQGMEDRLTQLADFDEVIAKFTKKVSGQDAEAAADRLLRSLAIRSQVAETAMEILQSATGFMGLGDTDGTIRWRAWVAAPETELLSLADVTGHEIEGDIWYTAKAQWLLYGAAIHGDSADGDAEYTACVWETKVLFSADGEEQTPTLLTQGSPSLPDTDDQQCAEILQKLKAKTAAAAQRALDMLSARSSGAAAYVAQQMAAKPIATLAQFTSANPASALMLANIAQPLIGFMPKSPLDIASITPGLQAAQSVFASMPKSTLDIASITPSLNLVQSALASMPKTIDLADINPSLNLVQSALASMPKTIDLAHLGIGQTAAEQFLASMPKGMPVSYLYPSEAGRPIAQGESDLDASAEDDDTSEGQG